MLVFLSEYLTDKSFVEMTYFIVIKCVICVTAAIKIYIMLQAYVDHLTKHFWTCVNSTDL